MSPSAPTKRPAEYLVVLSLLAFSFMLFQMSVLRELRYTLSTLFTLTPFVFSAVIFLIGLGSCVARWVPAGTRGVLRWSVAILPVALLPLFALRWLCRVREGPPADLFFRVGGDYIGAVGRSFIVVAVFGYGPVFFLQGLIFALYFREAARKASSPVSTRWTWSPRAGRSAGRRPGVICHAIQCVLLASGVLVIALWQTRQYLGLGRRPHRGDCSGGRRVDRRRVGDGHRGSPREADVAAGDAVVRDVDAVPAHRRDGARWLVHGVCRRNRLPVLRQERSDARGRSTLDPVAARRA